MTQHRTVAVTLCLLLSVSAFAQEEKAERTLADSVKAGCEKELTSLCKDVTPGEGRPLACLFAYQDKLSNRCEYTLYDASAQLGRAISAASYIGSECDEELQKHCAETQPGGGRILQCLKKSEKELSQRCKEALKDVQGK